MDAFTIMDCLFLRRIGWTHLPSGLLRNERGEEMRLREAIHHYRRTRHPTIPYPTVGGPEVQNLWSRLVHRSIAPSYAEVAAALQLAYRKKSFGIHETPPNLAEFVVERIVDWLDAVGGFSEAVACDPGCGSGVFLVHWLQRSIERAGSHASDAALAALRQRRIVGYDTDPLALHAADLAIREVLLLGAGVPAYLIQDLSTPVFLRDWLAEENKEEQFDVVMGNPPYVRTQHLSPDVRRTLRGGSTILVGRFDLSLAFVEAALDRLRANGILGFIVSNKMLMADYAKRARFWLAHNNFVREIHDFGDSHVFGAAVLPMVLVAQKASSPRAESFIYSEWKGGRFSVDANIRRSVTIQARPYRYLSRALWSFSAIGEELLDEMEEICPKTLGDYAERICVGIKTTANSVFADPVTEQFLNEHRGAAEIAHPVLRGINIKKWRITWTGRHPDNDTYILYPYREKDGRQLIPWNGLAEGVQSWLNENQSTLKNRYYVNEAGRAWYEIWVPQTPSLFVGPKIVVPDISDHNRFALDERNFFCLDSAYTIKLGEPASRDDYLYLLGWLNSSLTEMYFRARLKNALYGKRLRYMKSNLSKIPVLPFDDADPEFRSGMVLQAEGAIRAVQNGFDAMRYQEKIDSLVSRLISQYGNVIPTKMTVS